MLTYILIGAAILLLAVTCYLAGYLRSQSLTLDLTREENYDLVRDNSSLREKVAAHETSLTMLLDEGRRAS
jgi:hypothetical protein